MSDELNLTSTIRSVGCSDCESDSIPCNCCEWCEMFPCECVDDETGEPYNAAERLLDKVALTNPAAAVVLADALSEN